MLPIYTYKFDKGPLEKKDLDKPITAGNCRLAVQLYFYKEHGLFIEPEKILCPRSYKEIGVLILNNENINSASLKKMEKGDIIYAQKIRNKDNSAALKNRENFKCEDDWITALHTAIYFDYNTIWHASFIEGGSGYWDLDKFLKFYQPVAVKRFLV